MVEKQLSCPICKSKRNNKDFIDRTGRQYYQCKDCLKKFSPDTLKKEHDYRLANHFYPLPIILLALKLAKTHFGYKSTARALQDRLDPNSSISVYQSNQDAYRPSYQQIQIWNKTLIQSGKLKLFKKETELEAFFLKPKKWHIEEITITQTYPDYHKKPRKTLFQCLINNEFGNDSRHIVDVYKGTNKQAETYFKNMIGNNKAGRPDKIFKYRGERERYPWFIQPRFLENNKSKKENMKKLRSCWKHDMFWSLEW